MAISRETLTRLDNSLREQAARRADYARTQQYAPAPRNASQMGGLTPVRPHNPGPSLGRGDIVDPRRAAMSPRVGGVTAAPVGGNTRMSVPPAAKVAQPVKRRGRLILGIATTLVVVLAATAAGFFYLRREDSPPLETSDVQGVQLAPLTSGVVEAPDEVVQGAFLQLRLSSYDPELLPTVMVRVMRSGNETVFTSGTFELDASKSDFSVSINTATFEPGNYQLIVLDHENRQIQASDLTVLPRPQM